MLSFFGDDFGCQKNKTFGEGEEQNRADEVEEGVKHGDLNRGVSWEPFFEGAFHRTWPAKKKDEENQTAEDVK